MITQQNITKERNQFEKSIPVRQIVEIFFLFLLLFTIPIGLVINNGLSPENLLLLFMSCLTIFSTNVYFILRDKKVDVMSPMFFFSVIFFLAYIIPLGNFLSGTSRMFILWPYNYYDLTATLDKSFLVVFLMCFSFSFANLIPLKKENLDTISYDISKSRLTIVLIIFFMFGITCFGLAVILVGGISAFFSGLGDRIRLFAGLNYLFYSLLFLPISALIWWVKILHYKERVSVVFIVYTLITIGFSGFLGGKANTFMIILAFIVLFHKYVKPLTLTLFVMLSISGIFSMRLFEVFFREYLVIGKITSIDFSDPGEVINDIFVKSFEGNFPQFQILTVAVDYVPRALDYQYGKTYAYLFFSPIPSSVWKEKPLAPSAVLTLPIWPERWENSGTSIPPSLLGEFYINFGLTGVVVGMFAFGFIYNYFYMRFYKYSTDPRKIAFYSLLIAFMLYFIRGNFADPFILLMIMSVPLFSGFKYSIVNKIKKYFKVGVLNGRL